MLTASRDHSVFSVLFSRSIQASIGPVSMMLSVSLNIIPLFIPWSQSRMCNVQWLRTYWCKSALHVEAERKGSVVWIYFTAVNENDCTLLVKTGISTVEFCWWMQWRQVALRWQLSTPNCPPHVQWMNLDEATPPTVTVLSSAYFFYWLEEREQGGLQLAACLFPVEKTFI